MKRLSILAISVAAVLTSCSKGDDSTTTPGDIQTEYIPLAEGNYWVYDVTGGDFEASRDSLYVANDTVISGNTYQKLKTKNPAVGFYSASASRNSARLVGDKIVISGTAGLDFASSLPIEIDLTDFVVFKESASNGETLDSRTGSFQQDFNGFPLTVTYTLKTVADVDIASFTSPDGTVYSNVKPVSTILNLKITTSVGGFPIPVLNAQDVVTSKQHYAKNIGVVYTKTTVAYNLQDLGTPIEGIPQSYSQTSEEILDIYVAN